MNRQFFAPDGTIIYNEGCGRAIIPLVDSWPRNARRTFVADCKIYLPKRSA